MSKIKFKETSRHLYRLLDEPKILNQEGCDTTLIYRVKYGYPVAEGSADWALYQMMQGEKVFRVEWKCDMYCQYTNNEIITFRYGISSAINPVEEWIASAKRADFGWQIYKEPKPLLADAKEGWLVTNRAGHTSTIKYVDNNNGVLKYAYEISDGTTIYVRENGMFNIINHNSDYDIISTEPKPEPKPDKEDMHLRSGKDNPERQDFIKPEEPPKEPDYVICKRCGGSQSIPNPDVSNTACATCPKCGGTGYEIKQPKPKLKYKVGDCRIEFVKQELHNLLDKL